MTAMSPTRMHILPFVLIGGMLFIFSYYYGHLLINLLLPLYKWVIYQFEYRFDSLYLATQQFDAGNYLLIQASLNHAFYLNSELVQPSKAIVNIVSLPITNMMHPLLLILTIIWSWPIAINETTHNPNLWRIYLYRTIIALPIILFLMLSSTAILLISTFWDKLNKAIQINLNHSVYDYLSDIMNGGGLIAVSIALGLMIVGVVESWTKQE